MTTEGHESEYLVRVRAQVMTRDESTEGWLPLAGGGLANVSIRKRPKLPAGTGYEYIIYGQRISDQNVILSCVINHDLKYYKVMPTFHHWLAGKQRNGLTFQTAADARAFDKGIVRAYNDLIDGMMSRKNKAKWFESTKYESVGEDEVFMTLDLPVEPSDNQSSPEGSGSQKSANGEKQPTIHYISCEKPSLQLCPSRDLPTSIASGDNYSYVQLTAVNEFNYPMSSDLIGNVSSLVGSSNLATNSGLSQQDSLCSLKKRTGIDASVISGEGLILKNRVRCRYCHEFYSEEQNRRGTCEYAPDYMKSGLECISGMCCARCMLYHCMSDAEGDTVSHPCECRNEGGCAKRWIGLALLSLIVPCLWCYPPLKGCHMMCVSCGLCGGKHKP